MIRQTVPLALFFLFSLALTGCDNESSDGPSDQVKNTLPESAFKTIEWTDLMPQEDLDALTNPPSYITDVEDGSPEDELASEMQSAKPIDPNDPYQQALVSKRIIPEMDGKRIRLPGFVVPLEYDEDQTITEFFLVPFFGACIHVPPPPPNQIIHVTYPEGFKIDVLYEPFWVSGTLKTTLIKNDVATSAYSLEMVRYEVYTEEE